MAGRIAGRLAGLAVLSSLLLAATALVAGAAHAQQPQEPVPTTNYGALLFPQDEHQKLDGGNYWWGALNLNMESGNSYTLGIGWVSLYGLATTGGHQLMPHQGPYEGQMIASQEGPEGWGHENDGSFAELLSTRYVNDISTYHAERSPLYYFRTHDLQRGKKVISSYERIRGDRETYRLRFDQDEAKLHPDGRHLRFGADIVADMKRPPLLKGGTGLWFYGMPEVFQYPSRSFQYMQAARTLEGTIEIEQPDGTILEETIDPEGSQMVYTREHDATPEDFFLGLGLSVATQLHVRTPFYLQGYVPWDLIFLDLDNGAQLKLAMLAYHESHNGTLTPLIAPTPMPTYTVMATLRTPEGESINLDDTIRIEHLDYYARDESGPTPFLFVDILHGMWTQSWSHRVSHRRMTVNTPSGEEVEIPKFDLGVVPQFDQGRPMVDEQGVGMKSRIPFVAEGSWAGCPVSGFGWSEMINNWYGYEEQDPWFTGGELPEVPEECGPEGEQPEVGSPGELTPPRDDTPLRLDPAGWEGCTAIHGMLPDCEFVAPAPGSIWGFGENVGDWEVVIDRPGRDEPIVVRHMPDAFMPHRCGIIREGDHVTVTTRPGGSVYAGNPGLCL